MHTIESSLDIPPATARDPDELAYHQGVACEKAGQFADALIWHSHVRRGTSFDELAVASRIAVLLVLNRPREAVRIGIEALQRLHQPSPSLVNEVARAFNVRFGPAEAYRLGRLYTSARQCHQHRWLWLSTAAFASRSSQFTSALRCLVRWLELSRGQPRENIFMDMDFRPLWQHLAKGYLTYHELALLAAADWSNIAECVRPFDGTIGFESLPDLPEAFRPLFVIDSRRMVWHLRRDAAKESIQAIAAYLDSSCRSHWDAFLIGIRKASVILN